MNSGDTLRTRGSAPKKGTFAPICSTCSSRAWLPANASFGQTPKAEALTTPFGSFKIDYAQQGGELVVTARYSIETARVSAADYAAFRRFVSDITAALGATIEVRYE